MRKKKNIFQMTEQLKTPGKNLHNMLTSNLHDKVFKVIVRKMLH